MPPLPLAIVTTTTASRSDAIDLVLALARTLHRHGTPAHQLEAVLDRLSAHLRLEARYFAAPTALMSAFGGAGSQRTEMLRFDPGTVDLARLDGLAEVVSDVEAGRIDAVTATARIHAVDAAPSPWSLPVALLGHAAASGAAARFLGGGAAEIALAAVIGAVAASTSRITGRSQRFGRLGDTLSAFVATSLALLASSWSPVATQLVVLAALIVHLPGFTTTVAMNELASRHLISGTSRLLGAATTFVELAFGAALATQLFGTVAGAPAPLPAWTELVALAITPVALMIVLQARPRDLVPIALSGIVGFAAARVGAAVLGPALGAFPAALAVVAFSHGFHRATGRPAVVPLVPGLLLLVPGSLGLRSLTTLVEGDLLAGLELAVTAVMVSASIVAGTLVANAAAEPSPV